MPMGGLSTPPAGNRVYFFKDVSHESVADLCRQVEEAAQSLRTTFSAYPEVDPPPVHLYLDSYGGGLLAGLSAYHYIRQLGYPVHAHVLRLSDDR